MSENLTMDDLPAYDTPEMPDQEEAEYDGETVTLYDPFRIDDGEKKFAVYVRNPDSGNVNKLKFGSADMEIERDDAENLKSFRERFSCGDFDQGDKHTATFWSCVFWRKDLSVSDILSEHKAIMTEDELRSIIREELIREADEAILKYTTKAPFEYASLAYKKADVQVKTKEDGRDKTWVVKGPRSEVEKWVGIIVDKGNLPSHIKDGLYDAIKGGSAASKAISKVKGMFR